MRGLIANERGAVALVFIAAFLPLLLVLSAVALDFGAARVHRMRLQTAADAAALAGAREHDIYAEPGAVVAYGRQWATHSSCTETNKSGECVRWETWGHYHYGSWPVNKRVLAREAEAEARAAVPPGWEFTDFSVDQTQFKAILRSTAQVETAAREAWRVNAARAPGASAPDIRIVGPDTVEVSGAAEQRTGFLGLFGVRRLTEHVGGSATARPR